LQAAEKSWDSESLSKDASGLPGFDLLLQQQLSQSGQNKDKLNPGIELLLQQQLAQSVAASGQSTSKDKMNPALDLLLQQQFAQASSSKDKSSSQLAPSNLDLLLQMQLAGKDNKNLSGWEALALSQMQMGQVPSSSKAMPNFEALALAQLQLAQSMKDVQSSSHSQSQIGQNLKNSASYEAMQHMAKSSKESKAYQNSLDALASLQMAAKDKSGIGGANFGGFDMLSGGSSSSKDMNKMLSGLPALDPFSVHKGYGSFENLGSSKDKGQLGFPNFEALALAQLQMSQGMKDKGFPSMAGLEALAKLQQTLPKDKSSPGLESLQLLQSQMEALSKDYYKEWDREHEKDKK